MSNKFIIRNLSNEKRRIEKLISKLEKEDREKALAKTLATITEERNSVVVKDGVTKEINENFKYKYIRKGNIVECHYSDCKSSIVGIGVAKCHDEDDFDELTGCTIAERRAIADYYKQVAELFARRYK